MVREYARRHVYLGLFYTFIGLVLGIIMAATQDHGQMPTHAHIMLLGGVMSILYGVVFHLWISENLKKLANAQMLTHHLGAIGIITGLYFLYRGGEVPAFVEPMLGVFSVIALIGAVLALVIFWKSDPVDTAGD